MISLVCKGSNIDRFVAHILSIGCELFNVEKLNEKTVKFTTSKESYERLLKSKLLKFYAVRATNKWGIKEKLIKILSFSGSILGVLVGVILILLSSRFVTNIEIERAKDHICSNHEKCIFSKDNMTELEMYLESIGVYNGQKISSINVREVERMLLLKFESLTSCTIKKSGTKIKINLHEGQVQNSGDSSLNIIAPENAKIVSMTVSEGIPQVKAGDVVKKGQVLVKGESGKKALAKIDMKIYYHASKTYFESQYEIKYTGNEEIYSYFIIAGNEILKKETKPEFVSYKTQIVEQNITNLLFIPIKKVTVKYLEYNIVEKVIPFNEQRINLQDELIYEIENAYGLQSGYYSCTFAYTVAGDGCYLLDCYAEIDYTMKNYS